MELQTLIMTGEEKEALIQRIWVDKRGRVDRGRSLALYVSLDSPRPNMAQITGRMLEGLSKDPVFGFNWAEDWGRVVICVGPGNQLNCILGDTNDSENRKFFPVHTTRSLESQEMQALLGVLPEGSLGTILINSQGTTIEALLISYLHMLDQAIWDIFRSKFEKSGVKRMYKESVELVMRERFSLRLATEEEILLAKQSNDRVSVRLYGSGVNKDVPRVMGAVLHKEDL